MTTDTAQTENATISRAVRRMLGLGLDAWNNLIVFCLAIGAVAAVIVGVSTFAVIRLQKAEAEEAKLDFERYRLATEEKTESLRLQIAGANARAAEADLARIRLEEKLAPRRIRQKDQQSIAAQISEFEGQIAGIGSSPRDIESERLEVAIHAALAMGGWRVSRAIPSHTPLWPGGVTVGATLHPRSQAAAKKLADALNGLGIYAFATPLDPLPSDNDPTNPVSWRVFVTIGAKPDADDPLQQK